MRAQHEAQPAAAAIHHLSEGKRKLISARVGFRFCPSRDIPDRSRGGPCVYCRLSSTECRAASRITEFVISQAERPGISPEPSWPTSDLLRPGSCLEELPAISLQ